MGVSNDLKYRHARLSEANSILQRDFATLLKRISELETRVASVDKENQALHADNERLEKERLAAEERADTAVCESQDLRKSAEAGRIVEALRAQVKNSLDQVQTLEEQKRILETEMNDFPRRLAAAAAIAAAMVNEDMEARMAVEKTRSFLADSRRQAALEVELRARKYVESKLHDAAFRLRFAEDEAMRYRTEVERLHSDIQQAQIRQECAEERATRADERAATAENAAADAEMFRASLARELRSTVDDAQVRVNNVANDAAMKVASERDKLHAEKARVLTLECTVKELEAQIAAAQKRIDFLAGAATGPHFGKYVRLKEENEELHEQIRLMQKSVRANCEVAPHRPEAATEHSGGSCKLTEPHRLAGRRRSKFVFVQSAIDAL